ncbi:MAG TPA: RNA polymerase sigma factor [Candidatus Paceibacterota bacterium]
MIVQYLGDEIKQEEMADEVILSRSMARPELFGLLVDKYQEAFVRKAKRILGDRPEVEDVVQETFTKIYLYGSKFETQEGASFSSWAYKILMNTTFTYYQKLKKRGEAQANVDEEILALAPDHSHRQSEKDNYKDVVASVLSRMPEPLARVLSLHFLDDKPQEQIADELGVSVSAVKTRVHRAKKEFKKISDSFQVL